MFAWSRPVSFVNARVVVGDGEASRLRFASTILSIDADPRNGDIVVDLEGAFVLPGLINAHDHLELNHYGRLKGRDRYENATDWIADIAPLLSSDERVKRNMSFPLASRLLAGAVKNVLAGVTTVAHHNPRYREIGPSFPVRVVKRYGWAHSFELEGKPVGARGELGANVDKACAATPRDRPFIVHAGEGVDARAGVELAKLEALGCLRENTVLVHGVAITMAEWRRVVGHRAGLVWCPASNLFLFGKTVPIRRFLDDSQGSAAHVCLGSDSRLTGARDLLDEMRVAKEAACLSPRELLRAVTEAPARMLKLPRAGRIAVGSPADLVVLPPTGGDAQQTLLQSARRDVSLVAIGGRPIVGAPALRPVFAARGVRARAIVVDGAERIAESGLAAAIARSPIQEPGLECL